MQKQVQKQVNEILNMINQGGLKEKVSLYVPSTKNIDQPIDNAPYVAEVIKRFSILFGGATSQQTTGGWYSNDLQKIVTEKVTIVYSYTDKLTDDAKKEVIKLALKLKEELEQDAISLEINNQLFFI